MAGQSQRKQLLFEMILNYAMNDRNYDDKCRVTIFTWSGFSETATLPRVFCTLVNFLARVTLSNQILRFSFTRSPVKRTNGPKVCMHLLCIRLSFKYND